MTHSTYHNLKNLSFIDLTHPLLPSIPHWGRGCGFKHTIISDYKDCKSSTKFRAQSIEMFAGIGTHIDAPIHCIPNATDIANLALDQLISPCVVIDVSSKANEKYSVKADDIRDFEAQHGTISKNSF